MKKIIVFLLILSTVFEFHTSTHAASETYDTAAAEFLIMLGITDSAYDLKEYVTRAQFTDLLIGAINSKTDKLGQIAFKDVDASNAYASSISKAYELGIITGGSTGRFMPDEYIESDAAIKMLICALGYQSIAEAYGGYPTGYRIIADRLEITEDADLPSSGALTFGCTSKLMYNFLTSGMYCVEMIRDGEFVYSYNPESTPLSEYFGLESVDGVVKTAGYVSMIPDYEYDESIVTIDTKTLKFDYDDLYTFLGLKVSAWYNSDNKELKALYVYPDNNVMKFDAKDIDRFENGQIIIYDSETGKEKIYTLDASYTFVKNGRNKNPSIKDFLFESGKLELIDNNGDGKADVVNTTQTDHIVISHVNFLENAVYDTGASKSLVMSCEDGFCSSISMIENNGKITACTIKDIEIGNVLTYAVSEDGKCVQAILSKNTISGTVDEIGTDFIVINNQKYEVNSYFGPLSNIPLGENITFLMAADGTITDFDMSHTGNFQYGYLLDFHSRKTGFESKSQISVLTTKNKIIEPCLAEKIYMNGIKMVNTDERIASELLTNGVPNYQVIRYRLNEEGNMAMIDTAGLPVSEDLGANERYGVDFSSDDGLKCQLMHKKIFFESSYNMFSPHAVLGSNTIMFGVPQELAAGNSTQSRLDTDNFSVVSKNDFSYGTYTIDAYDMDEHLKPAIVVFYSPNVGESITIQKNAASAIVEEIRSGYNSEGIPTKIIIYHSNGKYYKSPIGTEAYSKLVSENAVPKAGDIIRVLVGSTGDIKSLTIDASYDASQKTAIITSSAPKDGQSGSSYYRGRSYAHDDDSVTLVIDQAAGFNSSYSDPIIANVAGFTLSSNSYIAVFDTKSNMVKKGSLNDLQDILSVGEANVSKVVLKCYSHSIRQLYIYK